MSVWATTADVQAVYEGTIPARTQALLDRIERRLARRVPRIAERIALDPTDADYLDPDDVKDVVVDATLRIVRNPKGYQFESDGEYSYRLADGTVGTWFTEEELALLRPAGTGRVGTIDVAAPDVAPDYPRWEPEPQVWL